MNVVAAREREAQVAVGRAQETGRRLAQRESRWLVPLGRLGYAAIGVVYGLIGILAVEAALGQGGDTTDSAGVLVHVLQAPFGQALLAIVTVGLIGYAVWRMLQATLDTEHQGTELKGIAARCGYAVAAFTYAGLAISAATMLTGGAAKAGGDESAQDRTAWLLSQPFGRWLVVLASLVVIGVAINQFVLAWRARLDRQLPADAIDPRLRDFVRVAARLGNTARGTGPCCKSSVSCCSCTSALRDLLRRTLAQRRIGGLPAGLNRGRADLLVVFAQNPPNFAWLSPGMIVRVTVYNVSLGAKQPC